MKVLNSYAAAVFSITSLSTQIKEYEKLQFLDERLVMAKEIYDNHIMTELLARSHVSV